MRQLKITQSITNRESISLEKYFQEIGKEELLSVDEEVALAQKIKKGDKTALERLTKANLRFVVSVAKQYQNKGLSLPDLINEGNMGLIKAAKRFDETKGFKFISYAVWWIRQSIMQALAEQSRTVRLPLNQVDSLRKINKMTTNFEQENQRPPTPEEIAKMMDTSHSKVIKTLSVSGKAVSFDAPIQEEEEDTMINLMESKETPKTDNNLLHESLKDEIERTLVVLPQKERKIIKASYGIGQIQLSPEEIGQRVGLTSERVRQIRKKALNRLRESCKNKVLKEYLG